MCARYVIAPKKTNRGAKVRRVLIAEETSTVKTMMIRARDIGRLIREHHFAGGGCKPGACSAQDCIEKSSSYRSTACCRTMLAPRCRPRLWNLVRIRRPPRGKMTPDAICDLIYSLRRHAVLALSKSFASSELRSELRYGDGDLVVRVGLTHHMYSVHSFLKLAVAPSSTVGFFSDST